MPRRLRSTDAILRSATIEKQRIQQKQDEEEKEHVRWQRIRDAWNEECYFKHDEERFWPEWARRIVALVQTLHNEREGTRLANLKPGDDSKDFAISVYRLAKKGDADAVMRQLVDALPEAAGCSERFRARVMEWLRYGLMKEMFTPEERHTPRGPTHLAPLLNVSQQKALKYIKENGPVGGKDIARHLKLTEEHCRRWFQKNGPLTAHGVRNGAQGYFLPV